jgi:hypothetical protein
MLEGGISSTLFLLRIELVFERNPVPIRVFKGEEPSLFPKRHMQLN